MTKDSDMTTNKAAKPTGKKSTSTKPKRPLSAYNFFFREQRTEIVAEAAKNNEKVGFEEIGQIIGERWQNIKEDEEKLAKYKVLADADSAKYKSAMEQHHKDELAELALLDASNASTANLAQLQALPFLASNSTSTRGTTTASASQTDQVLQMILQRQQQAQFIPSESVLQLLLAQRSALANQLNAVQLKLSLLENMIAKESSSLQQHRHLTASSMGAANIVPPSATAGGGQGLEQLAELLQGGGARQQNFFAGSNAPSAAMAGGSAEINDPSAATGGGQGSGLLVQLLQQGDQNSTAGSHAAAAGGSQTLGQLAQLLQGTMTMQNSSGGQNFKSP